jgi:pimeloyl-ACP methyl ester carboxylesterase
VLIHGWCCDRTFLAPQLHHFHARGHTVLALDLSGHGESDKPDQRYSFTRFGNDVRFLCEQLELDQPVLIGHSMGGVVAFELASRFPLWPRAIVMIDSGVACPDATRKAAAEALPLLEGPDGPAHLRAIAERAFFLPTDDAARRAHILDVMGQAPKAVMVSGAEMIRDYNPSPAKGRLVAPALYIAADEPSARSDLDRLKDLVPHVQTGRTVGSGHFCQLEVPDQVNAMIARFLLLTLERGPASGTG